MRIALLFLSVLTALVALVVASPQKRDDMSHTFPIPLDIVLRRIREDRFDFEALIFNHNKESIKVLSFGTFLHKSAPVKKAEIFSRGKRVNFLGVVPKMDYSRLGRKEWTMIHSGRTKKIKFNIAENYDLSGGGDHTIQMLGTIAFAQRSKRKISGYIPYQSNKIDFKVSGEAAASVRAKYVRKRRRVRSENCRGGRVPRIQQSLSHCVQMATSAQDAALNGPAWRMEEAFGFSDTPIRQHVANVFAETADRCRQDAGQVQNFCREYYRDCISWKRIVSAYLREPSLQIGYCDNFYDLPALPKRCYVYDRPDAWGWFPSRASIVVQKTVHLNLRKAGVPGNSSLDAEPGLPRILALDRNSSLQSPDNYELFATHVNLGCLAVSPEKTAKLEDVPLFSDGKQ